MDLDDEELKVTRMMNGADRNSRVRVNKDIEVNDYVRTKNGVIDKVDALYGMIENKVHLENQKWFDTKNIVKHSKQPIDLIQNKDILKVRIDKTIMVFGMDEDTSDIKYKELIENIENGEYELLEILTHEQFETNCYKVGGEDE